MNRWLTLGLLALVGCGPTVRRPPPPAPTLPGAPPVAVDPAPTPTPVEVAPTPTPAPQAASVTSIKRQLGAQLVPSIDGPALELHMVDIGQGDGMLIKTPGGRFVLIDTGPDRGTKRLMRYLESQSVHGLALTVHSHPHADHIAGIPAVMEKYPVKLALDSGFVYASPHYKALLQAVNKHKVPLSLARPGKLAKPCHVDLKRERMCRSVTIEDGVTFEVLAPDDPMLTGTRSDANSNSIILRLDYKGMVFLFTGDAEEPTEHRLLQRPERLDADVLKVAHHGSAHASQPEFLRAVTPKLALISCSARNNYGHPAPDTVKRLTGSGAAVMSTHKLGHIKLRTDGEKFSIEVTPRKSDKSYNVATDGLPSRFMRRAAAVVGLAGKPIDVNTASLGVLVKLPGVGKKTAQRIIDSRTSEGPFRQVDDLRRVKGIGKKTLEKIRPFVKVAPPAS